MYGLGAKIVLYYSYSTLVGFHLTGKNIIEKKCAIENQWGQTTGKLINIIEPDKKMRMSSDMFHKMFCNAMQTFYEENAKEQSLVDAY
jgi:hypothetical protein